MTKQSPVEFSTCSRVLFGALLMSMLASGCSDDDGAKPGDAKGTTDTVQDASPADGGAADTADTAGGEDTGSDAGPTDAGADDTGAVDSGAVDAGPADGGVDDTGAGDAMQDDAVQGDAVAKCPGAAGCSCDKDDQCDDQLCMPGPTGDGLCANPCKVDTDCGETEICRAPPGEDTKFCVPDGISEDAPCLQSAWCATGMTDGICASYGPEGGFCRPTCTTEDDCGATESCTAGDDVEGNAIKFCKGDMPTCSPFALAVEATTTCWADGKPGCTASRACVADKDGKPVLQPCSPAAVVAEVCDGIDGNCDGKADSAALCDDGNACTDDACKGAGGCENTANTGSCDDGSPCTKDGGCVAKLCVSVTVTCDDSNVCTDDSCDMSSGCTATANSAGCDDGDACTGKDSCAVGLCAGVTVSCDDNNVCTNDSCAANSGCAHTANSAPCDDGNACTKDDTCAVTLCAGATVVCADDNPCTDDSCDVAKGCQNDNNSAACDDSDACTDKDGCAAGLCKGATAVNCDDANACTLDSCDIAKGCTVTNATIPCEDGDACTEKEACDGAGTCKGGTKVDCEDGNVCTDDPCDVKSGCVAKTNNTNKCDDGQPCTENDKCDGAGKCAAGDALCGGSCAKCADGKQCSANDDCQSGSCVGTTCVAKPVYGANALLINEVDYDQAGSDTAEFIEIYNPATVAVELSSFTVEHVNGGNGNVVWSLPLSNAGATLAGGGYMVLCAKAVCDALPAGIAFIDLGGKALQNGAPDGVRLMVDGKRIDGVAYEGTMVGVGEGGAAPADTGDGSIARCPNGANTDDNSVDFKVTKVATPGLLNVCVVVP